MYGGVCPLGKHFQLWSPEGSWRRYERREPLHLCFLRSRGSVSPVLSACSSFITDAQLLTRGRGCKRVMVATLFPRHRHSAFQDRMPCLASRVRLQATKSQRLESNKSSFVQKSNPSHTQVSRGGGWGRGEGRGTGLMEGINYFPH